MIVNCHTCSKEIERKPCMVKRSQHNYCSYVCRSKGRDNRIHSTCDACGKKIIHHASRYNSFDTHYCNMVCFGIGTSERRRQSIDLSRPDYVIRSAAVHTWVRRRLPKPDICPNCNIRKTRDLANIAPKPNPDTYIKDLKYWEWLCRKCHMEKDGRLEELKKLKSYLTGKPDLARALALKGITKRSNKPLT